MSSPIYIDVDVSKYTTFHPLNAHEMMCNCVSICVNYLRVCRVWGDGQLAECLRWCYVRAPRHHARPAPLRAPAGEL